MFCTLLGRLKEVRFQVLTVANISFTRKTQHFSITKSFWLVVIKEIIYVYSENQLQPINALYVKIGYLILK